MLHLTRLCAFAFCAGMIDAVVGGGLIQIPAPINVLPCVPDAWLGVGVKQGAGNLALKWQAKTMQLSENTGRKPNE